MLDFEEYSRVVKSQARDAGNNLERRFAPLLREYERITRGSTKRIRTRSSITAFRSTGRRALSAESH
jgi:hypothetical protein